MKAGALLLTLTLLCTVSGFASEEGLASWYAGKFQGRLTASGEVFDTNRLTAAHKTLPFGTLVRVTNLESGRQVVVRINDRGPFVEGRIIDLSRVAAEAIGATGSGVARVRLEVVQAAGGKSYTVQAGAYSNEQYARAAGQRLEGEGLAPVLVPTRRGLTRVQLQAVPEAQLADVKAAAARAGFPRVLVIEE